MNSERTRILVEMALAIALAWVLNLLKLWHMPMGGTVGLVMLPIIVIALRRGLVVGLVTGAAYGFVDLMVDPYVVHWAQLLLDYPLAYMMVGLAGLFAALWRKSRDSGSLWLGTLAIGLGATAAAIGRYAMHVGSGVIFFGEYAPAGQPVLVYSLLYNLYVPISAALAFAVAILLMPALEKAVPVVKD